MTYLPLERLLRELKQSPEQLPYIGLGGVAVLLVLAVIVFFNRMYFKLVAKSLLRNPLRTLLSSLAVVVLVFVMSMLASVLLFIELAMTERNKDFKAIIT